MNNIIFNTIAERLKTLVHGQDGGGNSVPISVDTEGKLNVNATTQVPSLDVKGTLTMDKQTAEAIPFDVDGKMVETLDISKLKIGTLFIEVPVAVGDGIMTIKIAADEEMLHMMPFTGDDYKLYRNGILEEMDVNKQIPVKSGDSFVFIPGMYAKYLRVEIQANSDGFDITANAIYQGTN